jgi:phosphatidylglycerophosphate synthase
MQNGRHSIARPARRFTVPPAVRELGFITVAHLGLLWLLMAASPVSFGLMTLVSYLLATALLAMLMRGRYPHARLGVCNAVTHLRLTLTVWLYGVLVQPGLVAENAEVAWVVTAVALVSLSLDGIDGWMARQEGLASAFGARFDVEVDAALALGLSLLVWQVGLAGFWVLALGLPRYVFLTAQQIWGWVRTPLPPRRDRKVVCAMQITALIALLCPVVPAALAQPCAAVAAVVLLLSFTRDTLWLWRRRRPHLA